MVWPARYGVSIGQAKLWLPSSVAGWRAGGITPDFGMNGTTLLTGSFSPQAGRP